MLFNQSLCIRSSNVLTVTKKKKDNKTKENINIEIIRNDVFNMSDERENLEKPMDPVDVFCILP